MSRLRTKSAVAKANEGKVEGKNADHRRNDLTHADFIERLIIETTSNKQRRRPSTTSSNHSYAIDRLLQDENNDWLFEKILEKFENIRSKKTRRYPAASGFSDDNDAPHGIERIVERRYYVKKASSASKRDQLTSTSDLTVYGRKNRQYSGVSSVTAASTICSRCSGSTPTYIENLRDQSDTLRTEINDLKNEIEQLQTSQQEFFEQLKTHFQVKPESATANLSKAQSTNSSLSSVTEKPRTSGNLPVPVPTGKKSRSISTESQASSSSSSSSSEETTTVEIAAKPNPPLAPVPVISEFIATKNPTIVPTPSTNTYASSKVSSIASTPTTNSQAISRPPPVSEQISSKPPSIVPTPAVSEKVVSKPPSIAPTTPVSEKVVSKPPSIAPTTPVSEKVVSKPPSVASVTPVNEKIHSKPPSIAPTSPVNGPINPTVQTTGQVSSQPSSVASTPRPSAFTALKNPVIVPVPTTAVSVQPVNPRTSSVAPTPPTAPPFPSSGRIPIYENELAHRRILSPRSQIVASSVSIPESSDSSSGSTSPETTPLNPPQLPKTPVATLRNNELNDLVQYSSRLELSGFAPAMTPVITNPNTNSTFWDSVDQYIDNARLTNMRIGLPPTAPLNNRDHSWLGFTNNATKQLDKYDLEIKPQVFIESSAPLLMPPIDLLY